MPGILKPAKMGPTERCPLQLQPVWLLMLPWQSRGWNILTGGQISLENQQKISLRRSYGEIHML